jgi:exo-beta-1,3-glucanase (GH17 family)
MAKHLKIRLFTLGTVMVLGLFGGSVLAANLPTFVGVNYGPFHKDGQAPDKPIPDSQFLDDLGTMAQKLTYIKTYGLDTKSRLDRLVPLSSQKYPKLKIFLGVYEQGYANANSNHDTVTKPQLDLAIAQANQYPNTVKCVVVGNECLPGDATQYPVDVQQLITDLQYVRGKIPNKNVMVTTCLAYGAAQTYGNQLAPYCDFMMVNIYPFYGKVSINGAWGNLVDAYRMFARQFAKFGKQLVVGETGWPSVGPANGSAVPSIPNEQTCISQILANASGLGPVFLFEAFDEPWKHENGWAAHWGLWDKDGHSKFPFNTHLTRDTHFVLDLNGNGSDEVAVLRSDLDRGVTEVHLRDSLSSRNIKKIPFFNAGWTPVSLAMVADINGNGSPEMAVLGFNKATGEVRVDIKDLSNKALVNSINFTAGFRPKELTVRSDNMIAVLGTDTSKGLTVVEVRHPLNGSLVKTVRWNNEL